MTGLLAPVSRCRGPHFADEAAARLAVAAHRAAGNKWLRARQCPNPACGQWCVVNRGKQGQSKPTDTTWWRVYKYRINHGLEHCRQCGRRDALTFDHIEPYKLRPGWAFDNTTILCQPHNIAKHETPGTMPSLAAEEAAAPPNRRWSQIGRELYGLPPRRRS